MRKQARVPAFLDDDDDDGPGFEYFEEPDLEDLSPPRDPADDEQEPPDGVDLGAAGGGSTTGMPRNDYFSPPETPASSPPPVTPRCKIVSARALKDGMGEEGKRKKREDRDHRVSGIDGEAGERSAPSALDGPQRKRGRNSLGSPGQSVLERHGRGAGWGMRRAQISGVHKMLPVFGFVRRFDKTRTTPKHIVMHSRLQWFMPGAAFYDVSDVRIWAKNTANVAQLLPFLACEMSRYGSMSS